MLPTLGPEPTRRGSIHGGVAGHFLHGVAPSAAMSTSVGAAVALALARAAALLLLSVPYLVCSCSRCCSRSCSYLRCCSDLATLQSTESSLGSVDFQGGSPELRKNQPQRGGGSPERYPTIYLRVQGGGGGRRRWWGGGVGIAGEKARQGGPTGMAGAAADRRWRVFSGRAGRCS